jgi:hypothetical protein
MPDNDGYHGIQQPNNSTDEYNAQVFVIRQILNGRNFCALVKVMSVTIPGALALAGTVDVQPLVNQLDGQGNAVPHGVVNDLPYLRMQGGANAIILDPEVGDIGVCVFADRDISSVQASRDAANPGSARRSDMADGIYLGGLLNAVPSQYVMFTDAGIEINSPTEVRLVAPVVTISASESTTITTPIFTVNGDTQFNGDATASGTITAPLVVGTDNVTFGGKSGIAHKHGGVSSGSSQSGVPV